MCTLIKTIQVNYEQCYIYEFDYQIYMLISSTGHQRNNIAPRLYTEYFQLIIRIICINVLCLLI